MTSHASEEQPYYFQDHAEAVTAGMMHYIDRKTGYQVWTELYLKERPCCKSACRHCPYGFKYNEVK